MMIGPGPSMRMVLISVRFFTLAPVFHASNGGSSFDGFGGATTACVTTARCLPTALFLEETNDEAPKKADLA